MKKWPLLVISTVLMIRMGVVSAEDYVYLFDPATMEVGQSVGEYLVVKEKCPTEKTCTAAEKLKYVTAVAGRTGRLEIPVNAGDDFEISFNILSPGRCDTDLTITLYLADDSSLPLSIGGCYIKVYYPSGHDDLNWKAGINDFRLISAQGTLKIGANDKFLENVELSLSSTITRIVLSKIDEAEEGLFEIRTRGIQKGSSTSCPTTTTPTVPTGDCTANYSSESGKVVIPCLAVPVTLPFGGTQVQNYSVEMQQQPNTFTFDLDLNTIVVH